LRLLRCCPNVVVACSLPALKSEVDVGHELLGE
jgi:hypothetical protein